MPSAEKSQNSHFSLQITNMCIFYSANVMTKDILHVFMKGQGHTNNWSPRGEELVRIYVHYQLRVVLVWVTHTDTGLPIQGPIRDDDHIFEMG